MNNYLVIDRMSNVFFGIFPLDKRPCFDMKMKIDAAYGVDVSKKEKLAVFAAQSDDSRSLSEYRVERPVREHWNR
jgi:hypothetical protein